MSLSLFSALRIPGKSFRRIVSLTRYQSNQTKADLSNVIENSKSDEPVSMENPFKKEKHECILCKMKIRPDYKNTRLLAQFVSPFTGRIYGRHITGLCRKRQEQVEKEIYKSQISGFMPFYLKEAVFLKDPKLFDPDRPIRPHKY